MNEIVMAPATSMTVAETMELATHFARSGFFKDASDPSKAIVKIIAGRELGIGPMTAMTGIHIVQGKPVLSAGLVGAMVLRSGRYTYEVAESTDAVCRLSWFRDGRAVGESSFTIDEAKRAGLTGKDTWKSYASDMLFSRALTRGARRFCPDVFLGAVYVADELEGVGDPHAPEPATTPSGNGRANGNGAHAADVIDVTPPASEPEPAPAFHATPLIDAMVDPAAGLDVLREIWRNTTGHQLAGGTALCLCRMAFLVRDYEDLLIVTEAADKAKGKLTQDQRRDVQAAIAAARSSVEAAVDTIAAEQEVEGV